MAGSGGDDVLPSGSVGRLKRASRDLVKVYGWLNWIVVDWVGIGSWVDFLVEEVAGVCGGAIGL